MAGRRQAKPLVSLQYVAVNSLPGCKRDTEIKLGAGFSPFRRAFKPLGHFLEIFRNANSLHVFQCKEILCLRIIFLRRKRQVLDSGCFVLLYAEALTIAMAEDGLSTHMSLFGCRSKPPNRLRKVLRHSVPKP